MINKILFFLFLNVLAFGGGEFTVYKSPTCGCCGEWVKHMEKNGYKAKVIHTDKLSQVKRELNVPGQLHSCHTAIIDGYVVEGHVPSSVVDKMIKDKPKIKGIASPGMPMGSPGMEQPGFKKDPNPIYAFDKNGKKYLYSE